MKSRIGYNLVFATYSTLVLALIVPTLSNNSIIISPGIDLIYLVLSPFAVFAGFFFIYRSNLSPVITDSITNPAKGGKYFEPLLWGLLLCLTKIGFFSILSIHPPAATSTGDFTGQVLSGTLTGLLINFFAITVIISLIYGRSGYKKFPAVLFWILATLLSFIEPLLILWTYFHTGLFSSISDAIFTMEIFYAINITAFVFVRYRGWLPALAFRITESALFTLILLLSR